MDVSARDAMDFARFVMAVFRLRGTEAYSNIDVCWMYTRLPCFTQSTAAPFFPQSMDKSSSRILLSFVQ